MKRLITYIAVAIAVAFPLGWLFDCEYLYWPMLWRMGHASAPSGQSYTQLVASRSGVPRRKVDWHHCGWCTTVYTHCKNQPVKAIISDHLAYLFDWDSQTSTLLPATIETAKAFPELIPEGHVVSQIGGGFDGQLYNDRACDVRRRGDAQHQNPELSPAAAAPDEA